MPFWTAKWCQDATQETPVAQGTGRWAVFFQCFLSRLPSGPLIWLPENGHPLPQIQKTFRIFWGATGCWFSVCKEDLQREASQDLPRQSRPASSLLPQLGMALVAAWFKLSCMRSQYQARWCGAPLPPPQMILSFLFFLGPLDLKKIRKPKYFSNIGIQEYQEFPTLFQFQDIKPPKIPGGGCTPLVCIQWPSCVWRSHHLFTCTINSATFFPNIVFPFPDRILFCLTHL